MNITKKQFWLSGWGLVYTGQVISAFNLESLYKQEYTYTGQVIPVFNLESLYRFTGIYIYTGQVISVFNLESLYSADLHEAVNLESLVKEELELVSLISLCEVNLESLVKERLDLLSLVRGG